MYEFFHELPNDLRKLGNFKIPGMLGPNGEHPADHTEAKFRRPWPKPAKNQL